MKKTYRIIKEVKADSIIKAISSERFRGIYGV